MSEEEMVKIIEAQARAMEMGIKKRLQPVRAIALSVAHTRIQGLFLNSREAFLKTLYPTTTKIGKTSSRFTCLLDEVAFLGGGFGLAVDGAMSGFFAGFFLLEEFGDAGFRLVDAFFVFGAFVEF